jgi:hypothetical protein
MRLEQKWGWGGGMERLGCCGGWWVGEGGFLGLLTAMKKQTILQNYKKNS